MTQESDNCCCSGVPVSATVGQYIGGWSFSEYAPGYSFGANGFPSGRIGFYTNIPGTTSPVSGVAFSNFQSWEQAPVHLNGRWINDASYAVNLTTHQSLTLATGGSTLYNAILLENVRLQKFQATFALTRNSSVSTALAGFIFSAAERGNYDYVTINHGGSVINPIGYVVAPSAAPTTASGGSNPSNIPICASGDTLWCRVQNDGTTLTVKAINSSTAPAESTWSSTTPCYSNTGLGTGGMIGFLGEGGIGYINNFTLKSYDTATSAFDITEHWDNFAVDGSGYADETPTYDAAGNLTYDGQQVYTWDAWNRPMTIAHAYRDSSGNLQHGQTFSTIVYDGRNRRIQKTITNTGQWDCNYQYYYTNSWQLVETRNGSSQTLKQHVWGIRYIDELVQIPANSNPSTGNTCSGWFYAMQDANFNVLGLVNTSGALVERYEYTPYGQRKVLFAAGNTWAGGTSTNDPGCYAIAYASLRYTSNAPYFGLGEIGHQGLMHDEGLSNVYNRERTLNPLLERFATRDRIISPTRYDYTRSNPVRSTDPFGLQATQPTTQSLAQLENELGHPLWGDYGAPHHPPAGPIPSSTTPAESQPNCGIRWLARPGVSGHMWIQIDFGDGSLPVGAGFWAGGSWVSWLPGMGGQPPPATGGPAAPTRGVPPIGYGDPYTGAQGEPVTGFAGSTGSLWKSSDPNSTLKFGAAAGRPCSTVTCRDIWDCIAHFQPKNLHYTAAWNDCQTVSRGALWACCIPPIRRV